MQITTFFSISIGAIVVVHFISLIAERFRPIKRNKNVRTTRENWYCFFSPNVLLGEDNTEKPVIRDTQLDTVRQRQQRRQQEQRRLILKL